MKIATRAGAGASLLLLALPAAAQIACADLAGAYRAPDVSITSSTAVPAAGANPAHCDVRGAISGNIKFALFLPLEWNGRFQMVGNGGKAGSIGLNDMRTQLRLGYASASTDTGHDNDIPEQGGARFGNNALFGQDLEIDFGWRAVHLTAVTSKDIVAAHYGRKASYSYWNGCSTGGRQGLMEAQRFPNDFDGYVIGAPVYDYTGQQMSAPAMVRPLYSRLPVQSPSDGPALSRAKRDMVGAKIYERCDEDDGVKDNQLRNPLRCDFDPAVHIPICSATSGPDCLTPNELAALQEIYAGKEPFVPGLPYGSENISGGWSTWILPNNPSGTPTLHNIIADAFEWLMFKPDRPGFDYVTQWDWSVHPFEMKHAERIYNATDPDLTRVLRAGKKIVMYHGFHDPGANPIRSIRYRQSVVDFLAKKHENAEALTDSFLKLYLVPGMAHCGGGTGHSSVDWLTPLVAWVENGAAPGALVGSRTDSGETTTRPHCPYPQEAVLTGSDPKTAASYTCMTLD